MNTDETQVAETRQTEGRLQRLSVFALVGGVGFLVQLAALQALSGGFGMATVPATACAVELAILHNFVWHERWTWADRAAAHPHGWWRRLGRFHVSSGVLSLVGNVAITSWVVDATGAPLLLANVLAVGACTALNFVTADRLVFGQAEEVDA